MLYRYLNKLVHLHVNIMKIIREILRKNDSLYQALKVVRLIYTSSFSKITGKNIKDPIVLQLPITTRCNARCAMCNIWNMDTSRDMDLIDFRKAISDPIFNEIIAVGVNGGEPSLIRNLEDYVSEILKLPKIKSFNVISNGFIENRFLSSLEKIYSMCQAKSVSFHIAISLDGFSEIHNLVRGVPRVFDKTQSTIDSIVENQYKYCDSFDVACTIVQQNIDNLVELDVFAEEKNYDITYRLGIDNKRIESQILNKDFSVIHDFSLQQNAKEFIHSQMYKSSDVYMKYKYYSIFYGLTNKKRLLGCAWKDEGITMDPSGDIFYCAVASDKIGSAKKGEGKSSFFSKKNINYRAGIIEKECDNCIHDYQGQTELSSVIIFIKAMISKKYSMKYYKFLCYFNG
jgi:MoaA/NifB/PqqE/SkfB family radical SAM enzyme